MSSPDDGRSPRSFTSSDTFDSLDHTFLREIEAAAQVDPNTWNPRLEAQLAINVRFYILYDGPNYQGSGRQYRCNPYTPLTRLIEFRQDDAFCRHGFPHEVTLPQVSPTLPHSWVTFPYFQHVIAANWSQVLSNAQGAHRLVTFSEVLQYRMLKQSRRSEGLFGILERLQGSILHADYSRRLEHMFSSIRINMNVNDRRLGSFWDLMGSTIIQDPFTDFVNHYLIFNPDTHVPLWDKIQAHLGKEDPTKVHRVYSAQERLVGLGARDFRAPIHRGNWSVERAACRFILWVYHILTNPETDDERKIAYNLSGVTGNYIDLSYVPPLADRHWFGYAVLCLLIWSWQYKREHDASLTIAQRLSLVPALDPEFQPRPFAFRPFSVGELDISPESPWIFERPDFDPHFPPPPDVDDPNWQLYLDNVSTDRSVDSGDDRTVISATSYSRERTGSEVGLDLIDQWAGVTSTGSATTHVTDSVAGTTPVPDRTREAGAPSPEVSQAAAVLISMGRATQPSQGTPQPTQEATISDISDSEMDDDVVWAEYR
jgi:hypothetical protein